jgi:N6-adenosine-specific RNA methylase IME4
MIDRVRLIEFHPLADIFPLVEGADFDELVADISAHGLREPIVVYRDKILDGRNRYRACTAARVAPTFTAYTGDNPVAYVISLNLRRRHLNESQRAMVAAKLATLSQGRPSKEKSPIGDLKQAEAAELLNVGKRSVERAADVREGGAPELVRAVERGDVSVSAAADIATLSKDKQRELIARCDRSIILGTARAIRAEKAEARHAERMASLADLARGNTELPTIRRFPILLVDPPWQTSDSERCSDRAPENHYPTMALDDICGLPIADLATLDAALFLWTTGPHLRQAFEVLEAWGFEYVSNIAWLKDKIGLGHWVRNQHELLLIARRGDMPTPTPASRPSSVISAPRREHSRKPDEAYEIIERMYPDLPKIELFARNAREGWAAWGNEVPRDQFRAQRLPEVSSLTNGEVSALIGIQAAKVG